MADGGPRRAARSLRVELPEALATGLAVAGRDLL